MQNSSSSTVSSALDNCLDFERPIAELEKKIRELEEFSNSTNVSLADEINKLRERSHRLKMEIYANLTPWQRVQLARYPQRPSTLDYINLIFTEFIELYGDRAYADDPAIVTGLGMIEDTRVMLIGHRKGKTTTERMKCNFGSPHPEGYRKALHKMLLAEKLNIPIVTLINTPGAYPGIGAEERGQAFAIAENLMRMFAIKVPIICVVIGEGGSGGALGIGIGDKFFILENSYFSVISPEGCAAILWRDGSKAQEAASALQLSPDFLLKHNIIDEVIKEPLGGAHRDHKSTAAILKDKILSSIREVSAMPVELRLEKRYAKYRKIGVFMEQELKRIEQ